MDNLKYPIGPFAGKASLTDEERNALIEELPKLTILLQDTLQSLTEEQLNTPYRKEGWTARQVVHHLADNELNAYFRLKKALTEDEPMAGTYTQGLWADLPDYEFTPVQVSVTFLGALQQRLYVLLSHLEPKDFKRSFRTPAYGTLTIDDALQRMIWHNKHHTAHVQLVVEGTHTEG
ncbi:hypothetical protein J2Z69_003317 [Paenibacillus shirakamiensis]|uniref:DinB-like domain-containing protein n=1 Tax=Paenibacillus shirakamiensis TaxID=1265935 RepID=A0ABS4JKK4_9BACL|nr:putative metal-dependent hydrolase [Paenibacillus shirakamiensis]MBP2002245.1 hypothetical protein [Paenibacillus shirakamiensis]